MVYRRNRKSPVKKAPARKMVKKVMKKRATIAPSVKAYVKRAIGQNVENKVASSITLLNDNINPMNSLFNTVVNLSSVWAISQGTGQGDRVGNSIKPKKWNFRGYISLSNTAGQVTIPGVLKMYIIKYKNGYVGPTNITTTANFYQNGNTTAAPTGNFIDVLREVNKDVFDLYTTRTFKVGPASLASTLSNNDYKATIPFNINCMKYQSHKIKFPDALTTPSNSGLFAVFAFAPYDGLSAGGGTFSNLPLLHYDLSATYEDA